MTQEQCGTAVAWAPRCKEQCNVGFTPQGGNTPQQFRLWRAYPDPGRLKPCFPGSPGTMWAWAPGLWWQPLGNYFPGLVYMQRELFYLLNLSFPTEPCCLLRGGYSIAWPWTQGQSYCTWCKLQQNTGATGMGKLECILGSLSPWGRKLQWLRE
jgi:hypothetical protein